MRASGDCRGAGSGSFSSFLQLHTHWETVENPRAWLFRRVRNRAFNHHRDNKREILTGSEIESETLKSESPENVLQRMEAAGFLRTLLAELGAEDRKMVELKYYEDLKCRDIADRMGISVGNVGYRLHHILKELAVKLRQFALLECFLLQKKDRVRRPPKIRNSLKSGVHIFSRPHIRSIPFCCPLCGISLRF
nr:RNA polymerase, sigma-24 subunit, ECF subfamily [uncultured bacterium]